ncbi:MAG: MBL fold metallo-hydrolase [Clostridia bacterium]|nr:MBL fold metallo-hydrolase [Clostridia bacterium]
MKITFLGANHEVTGSRTLIEWREGRYLLVDCGMEQGQNEYENAEMPVSAKQIEYVFITHAHIDHTGMLPKLWRDGFRGKVYTTRETNNLCAIMLADSAHIQMSDAEYQTKKNKRKNLPPVEPTYDMDDVNELLGNFRPCGYDETIRVDEGLTVSFTDIGHLMGSAAISLWLTDGEETRKIVFSGDVGNINQPLLNDPMFVREADYVVVESTYGDRLHADRIDPTPMMVDVIQRTLDRGGNVIIPSFAVGRTQEMLYIIRDIKMRGLVHGHDGFPVYVDSPLANEATAVFLQCDTECLDPEARAVMQQGINPISFPELETVVTADESKKLNASKIPGVIISASGMCDAGRVRHHLKHNLWRPECTVLFVGYQSNGTLGRQLQDGKKEVKVLGEEIVVRAEIATLQGVSGHADKNGLLRWMDGFHPAPPQIFVNHGDHDQAVTFTETLKARYGVKVDCPYSGSEFDLLTGKWLHIAEGVPFVKKKAAQSQGAVAQQSAYAEMMNAINALEAAAKSAHGLANGELKRLTRDIRKLTDELRT